MRSDRDQRLDELAIKISKTCEGVRFEDLLPVLSGLIAFCLNQYLKNKESKLKALDTLVSFILDELEGLDE